MATYTDSAYETFEVGSSIAMAIETFDCWEQLSIWTDFSDRIGSLLTESAVVGSSATLVAGGTATEVANISSSLHSEFTLQPGIATETAILSSSAISGWTQVSNEVAILNDEVRQVLKTTDTEALAVSDSVQSRTRSVQIVTDAFTIYSDLPTRNSALAIDSAVITGEASAVTRRQTLVTELVTLDDSVVQHVVARDTAESELKINDDVMVRLRGTNVATEQFYIDDSTSSPLHTAWVSDLRQLGMSRYEGLQSKQLAVVKGVTIGAADTGLFKLDNTVPVKALIKTGKADFDSDQKKRLEGVFAYGESASPLTLTVACDKRGEEVEYEYEFMNRLTDNTRNTRAKVGKGLSSRYYQLTISNPDGAYFATRKLFADVGVTARRI